MRHDQPSLNNASSLTCLEVRDFRCFEKLNWEPHPGLNFIIGPNAQGKTSILEATCILLRLRSPRTHALNEAIHFGKAGFGLQGNCAGRQMALRFTPQKNPKRLLLLDEATQQETCDYLATGRIVWFCNDDREIINGPGERRRRFLDSAGLQMGSEYGRLLKFYDRALRSRNLLLRAQRPRREIEAYDIPLAESGEKLIAARTHLCELLAPHAAAACRAISGEKLSFTYKPGATLPLLEAIAASQAQETQRGFTQVGPHRDDLSISLNGLPAATFASEGQRRTVALALKLALAKLLNEYGATPPLLLLDDIFGELDLQRRSALLDGLPADSQALLTTTHLETMDLPHGASVFKLLNNELTRQEKKTLL